MIVLADVKGNVYPELLKKWHFPKNKNLLSVQNWQTNL